MKIPITAALLLILASCNNSGTKDNNGITGAYKMTSQSVRGGKTDTTFTALMQQKIYTGDYMMYASFNPSDSACSFGIGTYTYNMDTLIEKVFFNGYDSNKVETVHNYKLIIEKNPTGYKQLIPEIESQGIKFQMTETYSTVSTPGSTALDGAWQLETQLLVKGKDTVVNKITQYKVYHAGHFIWGHSYTDSTSKIHTGVGFGTFTLDGTDKLKEHVAVSTYHEIRLQDVNIAVEMNGTDAFKQTILNKDSSLQVETYKRLKK
jgi:hypothetical protein